MHNFDYFAGQSRSTFAIPAEGEFEVVKVRRRRELLFGNMLLSSGSLTARRTGFQGNEESVESGTCTRKST